MNKRQIIHWCQGQYAAAAYRGKRGANSRPAPTPEELIDNCFIFGENVMKSFRMSFRYNNGREEYYNKPLKMTFQYGELNGKKVVEQVRFNSELLNYNQMSGLTYLRLYDHEGNCLVIQHVSTRTIQDARSQGKSLSAQIVLKNIKSKVKK